MSVDADGLATFVYEHSYIENKPAIKQYELCYKAEDLEEIEKHPDHVTSLRLSGEYFREEMITILDFASYGFSSLEYLYLAFSVCFWTDVVKMSSEWVSEWVWMCWSDCWWWEWWIDLPSLKEIYVDDCAGQEVYHVFIESNNAFLSLLRLIIIIIITLISLIISK